MRAKVENLVVVAEGNSEYPAPRNRESQFRAYSAMIDTSRNIGEIYYFPCAKLSLENVN